MSAARLQQLYHRLQRFETALADKSSKQGIHYTVSLPPEAK